MVLHQEMKLKELQKNPGVEIQTRNLLSETWLLLQEELRINFHGTICLSENENRLRNMLLFIHTHYSEKLTLEEIASNASLSVREAQRCFQRILHQSPYEYLISYRLNNAKKMLLETNDSITEIAFHCGFSDASYFSKTFRKDTGFTPMEYRKKRF